MKNTKQHAAIIASIEMTTQRPVTEGKKGIKKSTCCQSNFYDSIIIYIKKKSKQLRCFHGNFQNKFHAGLLSFTLTN